MSIIFAALKMLVIWLLIIASTQLAVKYQPMDIAQKAFELSIPTGGKVLAFVLVVPAMICGLIMRTFRDCFIWLLFKCKEITEGPKPSKVSDKTDDDDGE